jgi:hypothetical protein
VIRAMGTESGIKYSEAQMVEFNAFIFGVRTRLNSLQVTFAADWVVER